MGYLKKYFFVSLISLFATISAHAEGIAQEDCNASFNDVDLKVQVADLKHQGGNSQLTLKFSNQNVNSYELYGVEIKGCKAANSDIKLGPVGIMNNEYSCDSTFNPKKLRVTFYARDLAWDEYSPALRVCDVVKK